ncbi:MAG: hypothetical protein AB7I19_05505 [Planctomycetota bacterium]
MISRISPLLLELGQDFLPLLLIIGPAVVGVAALVAALVMIAKPREPDGVYVGRWIGIGVLLIVFLGIGTCYAVVLEGPLFH